ncbi:uncharacterized protein YjlB [Nitrobacteraceae bacterium AZCC 1564]
MDDFPMSVHHTAVTPVSFVFTDDGTVPNNSLPFLIYKNAFEFEDRQPEEMIESVFRANNWSHQMWRNGVFDYLHYHATVHEVLGIARGRALVRFGGDRGEEFEIHKGDVAVLPAGTGHQCLSASSDFLVIGSYPPGADMQITRPTSENHRKALKTIPKVALPQSDPIYGTDGPLTKLWGKAP